MKYYRCYICDQDFRAAKEDDVHRDHKGPRHDQLEDCVIALRKRVEELDQPHGCL